MTVIFVKKLTKFDKTLSNFSIKSELLDDLDIDIICKGKGKRYFPVDQLEILEIETSLEFQACNFCFIAMINLLEFS